MVDLTAIILTKNEDKNIEDCLKSIKGFAKRVVVVDSGSTDNTVELAKKHGADVYYNEFDYYAQQFNWGIYNTNITTDWILRLDADERFTPELCEEVEYLLDKHKDDSINGITMEAWLYFMGKKLRYGASKKRKIMIFRRGFGKIEDRKRDAHTILFEGDSVVTKNRFIHYDFKDINHFINKYNYYATRETEDYLDYLKGQSQDIETDKKIAKTRKKKFNIYYKAPMFLRAKLWYIYNYYFRLGFMDGREGQIYHWLECHWYRYLVDVKIREKMNVIDEDQ
ncbi:glycosyltransferase family 2 protein [Globicatella sulfidifaciens]|uniref:Glycosyltransferase family 2 protein n=1 Tax=Globicatella sulfidifaciens TaxID=136093 RepID=A0A7X8C3H5_9LACT|nr:glycosyltransferase family 2 protein [Globicatella sulfidifaciens]NLJ18280.1 glycosyltransferase family 2 protein [Globicatella sulfidifaciens]